MKKDRPSLAHLLPAADITERTRQLFGAGPEPAPAAPPTAPKPAWVAFASYLRPATYRRLKQAAYWRPGFEIREAVDAALAAYLDQFPEADRPLPPAAAAKLRH